MRTVSEPLLRFATSAPHGRITSRSIGCLGEVKWASLSSPACTDPTAATSRPHSADTTISLRKQALSNRDMVYSPFEKCARLQAAGRLAEEADECQPKTSARNVIPAKQAMSKLQLRVRKANPSFPRNRLCQNAIPARQRPPESSFPRKRESRWSEVRVLVRNTPQPPLDSRFRGNDGGAGMTCFVRRCLDSVPESCPL